jgi:UDP-3-O-[3-hydroxymyristoyl] glucosamine N-acyltransferase
MTLEELAERIGGRISGDPAIEITGVAGLREARKGDITFLLDRKNISHVMSTEAAAIIITSDITEELTHEQREKLNMLLVENPQLSFAKALEVFYPAPVPAPRISDDAIVGKDIHVGDDVAIYPLSFIGDKVRLGSRVTVSSGVYIGAGVEIDDDTYIHPNVTIRENTRIGKHVTIHAGTVIGSDGFGYVLDNGMHHKIPQVGGVVIEDNVEIGANVTIDRATVGDTVIGSGTKIDNLVQIAHNVKIGKNCIIVSQVGISGSVDIGDGAVIAGQVGIRDHLSIGKGAMIGAQSGVGSDIPDGQIYSGSPAIPHRIWLRAQSMYAKLPDYVKRIQKLERKLRKEEP